MFVTFTYWGSSTRWNVSTSRRTWRPTGSSSIRWNSISFNPPWRTAPAGVYKIHMLKSEQASIMLNIYLPMRRSRTPFVFYHPRSRFTPTSMPFQVSFPIWVTWRSGRSAFVITFTLNSSSIAFCWCGTPSWWSRSLMTDRSWRSSSWFISICRVWFTSSWMLSEIWLKIVFWGQKNSIH